MSIYMEVSQVDDLMDIVYECENNRLTSTCVGWSENFEFSEWKKYVPLIINMSATAEIHFS